MFYVCFMNYLIYLLKLYLIITNAVLDYAHLSVISMHAIWKTNLLRLWNNPKYSKITEYVLHNIHSEPLHCEMHLQIVTFDKISFYDWETRDYFFGIPFIIKSRKRRFCYLFFANVFKVCTYFSIHLKCSCTMKGKRAF